MYTILLIRGSIPKIGNFGHTCVNIVISKKSKGPYHYFFEKICRNLLIHQRTVVRNKIQN